MSASADISGFLSGLGEAQRVAVKAVVAAVDVFGEHVIGDSQQLTPVDTGFLAASHTTEPAKLEGDGVSKLLGANADYAAAVHERLDQKHTQGGAKYLTNALKANEGKFGPFVGGRVAAALGGGGGGGA